LSFFGGYVGCLPVAVVGVTYQTNQMIGPFQLNEVLMFSGVAGSVLIRYGCIFDAIRVAKINSIAYDNQPKISRIHFNIGPSIARNVMNTSLNVGLKLNVNF
jgi:hypothetical protein